MEKGVYLKEAVLIVSLVENDKIIAQNFLSVSWKYESKATHFLPNCSSSPSTDSRLCPYLSELYVAMAHLGTFVFPLVSFICIIQPRKGVYR